MKQFNATRIASKLYISGVPPARLRERGFNTVVLCAEEEQAVQPDVFTIRVPFDDAPLSKHDYQRAVKAAMAVTKLRKNGQRVLVSCAMGINRSALVTALSLMQLERMSARQAIERIRKLRGPHVHMMPLCNPHFEKALYHFENLARGTVISGVFS